VLARLLVQAVHADKEYNIPADPALSAPRFPHPRHNPKSTTINPAQQYGALCNVSAGRLMRPEHDCGSTFPGVGRG
jgi:hypothetical protein